MLFSEEKSWSLRHFGGCALRDRRRVKRVVALAEAMARHPECSLPRLFDRPYDVKAAYNLFKRPDATPENLQAEHRRLVRGAIEQPGTYLLLEDTSDFVWHSEYEIDGLGPVGDGRSNLQGFFLHNVLAVRWSEEAGEGAARHPPVDVLGLADQQYYIRKPVPPGENGDDSWVRKQRERESRLWIDAGAHLGSAPAGARWLRVCDRGADIYEFFIECQKLGHGVVVRASQDRALAQKGGLLFEYARGLAPLGHFDLPLRKRPQHPARIARLAISAGPALIRSPKRPGAAAGKLPSVPTWVVRVIEVDAPAGIEPLEWIILTDEPVESFKDAHTTVLRYATRWVIEEYHKSLKSGLRANKLQLDTAHRLFAAIAIMSVVALRLLNLRELFRTKPDAPAQESGLTPLELMLLSERLGRKLETVADVALAVGRLGGHMNRKADGMPGQITLWRGMLALEAMAVGAAIALQRRDLGNA